MAMRRITIGVAVLGLLSVWACGGSSGTSIPDNDAGTTSGGTSGTSGVVTEPEDAGPIIEPVVDAEVPDVEPAGEIEIELTVDALAQSCMPIVAQDPVTMQGTIKVNNKSTVNLGALKFQKGTFLGTGGQVIATFATDTSPHSATQSTVSQTSAQGCTLFQRDRWRCGALIAHRPGALRTRTPHGQARPAPRGRCRP